MQRLFQFIAQLVVAVFALALPLSAQVRISLDEANTYTAARIGINQGAQNYWESYLLKNLTSTNPGFEAQMKDVVENVSANGAYTNQSFTSGDPWDSTPANFFAGGTFFVAYGANRGCSGTIASNTKADGKNEGPTFVLAKPCPHAFERGDVVFARKVLFPTPNEDLTFNDFGWDPVISPGGSLKIDSLPSDQFPGSQGKQCLELITSDVPGAQAGVRTPIDAGSILGYAFSGPYTQTIEARLVRGSGTLTLSGVRLNQGHTGVRWTQSFKPNSSWETYSAHFYGDENAGTRPGPVEICITFEGDGALLIDDSSLTSDQETNPTVFRDQVVRDEKLWDPGESRYWAGQNGESLANWIAPAFGREASSGAAGNYDRREPIQIGLQDWLAKEEYEGVPAVWIEMPITWRYDTDASNMVDYLAGGANTFFGRRRIDLGQKEPWTSVFHRIVLEYGNEVWNSGAPGENILPYSQQAGKQMVARWPYLPMAIRFCAAMKANPLWNSRVMKCAAGIQTAGNSYWAGELEKMDVHHAVDLQANNEYGQLHVTNATGRDPWISAWTEAWAAAYDKTNGFHKSFNGAGLQTGIYEYNNSTEPPSTLTQGETTGYANGEGYGLADILMPLFDQKVFGIVDNDFFTFEQRERSFENAAKQNVALKEWGAVTGLGGRYTNPRPMLFAIGMVNHCIGNGMGYDATVIDGPTYSFPGYNGVGPEKAVPYLNAFAFKNGNKRCIVVVNTDPLDSYKFRFTGDHPPAGSVTTRLYYSPNLTDNNEREEVVRLASATTENPGSFEIQPHSALAISYQVSEHVLAPRRRHLAVSARIERPVTFPRSTINLLGDE